MAILGQYRGHVETVVIYIIKCTGQIISISMPFWNAYLSQDNANICNKKLFPIWEFGFWTIWSSQRILPKWWIFQTTITDRVFTAFFFFCWLLFYSREESHAREDKALLKAYLFMILLGGKNKAICTFCRVGISWLKIKTMLCVSYRHKIFNIQHYFCLTL